MKIKKKFLEWSKSKVTAFTLLECLLTLLIISGSLIVYQGLTKSLFANCHYLAKNDQDQWLLFAQQLRTELAESHLPKVVNNKLYVEKGKKSLAFGQYKSHDFRKTSQTGRGYQPMLFHLTTSKLTLEGERLHIHFKWESGLERIFIYDFQEKS